MSFIDDWENLAMFTAGEFSDLATVISGSSVNLEISGIFNQGYEPMFSPGIAEGRCISFLVETAQTTGLHHGDRLIIKGKEYKITEINPMDDGKLSKIVLKT